ncbi:glutamate 5-kinase [Halofilum ochraceum]|uniref:glutamate 5-kinase n=1 Tax=Halofilum ochraceum TaxID=1611323 RepID=UPI0008DA19B5|nr:glutamate 5-kinase [Halofilum ochraceum]
MGRERLQQARRWVVKIGSSLVTANGRGLDRDAIKSWSAELAALHADGVEVVLVSSGAVAEGMSRLGWRQRPHALHELQAAAAVGQMGLVQAFESAFRGHGIGTAQILLTHDDVADRQRYLNARSTLRTLGGLGVIPIVNENDTVANDEFRFGENDTLAALVANLVEADTLVILTDTDGLYDRDPRQDPAARIIREGTAGDPRFADMAGGTGSAWGRGGMATKVDAAGRAARSGTATVIAPGSDRHVLTRLRAGDELGTLLEPSQEPLMARKRWLANHLRLAGALDVDAGAARALRASGVSLLAVGVTAVRGAFRRGEVVACIDPEGREVARGLVNYAAEEIDRLKGRSSRDIESILGYVVEPELIDRDNMVITG